MIYLYIRPEVKKNDTAAVTTAINEACIGGLQQNFWLVGGEGIFLVQEMKKKIFCCWVGFSLIDRVSQKKLGEGAEQFISGRDKKQDESSVDILGNMGDAGVV